LVPACPSNSPSKKSAGLSDRELEQLKQETAAPRVLAQVMAVRAARARLRQEAPKPSPTIDYNHM
jgi:hypothetical protein